MRSKYMPNGTKKNWNTIFKSFAFYEALNILHRSGVALHAYLSQQFRLV